MSDIDIETYLLEVINYGVLFEFLRLRILV